MPTDNTGKILVDIAGIIARGYVRLLGKTRSSNNAHDINHTLQHEDSLQGIAATQATNFTAHYSSLCLDHCINDPGPEPSTRPNWKQRTPRLRDDTTSSPHSGGLTSPISSRGDNSENPSCNSFQIETCMAPQSDKRLQRKGVADAKDGCSPGEGRAVGVPARSQEGEAP